MQVLVPTVCVNRFGGALVACLVGLSALSSKPISDQVAREDDGVIQCPPNPFSSIDNWYRGGNLASYYIKSINIWSTEVYVLNPLLTVYSL